MVEERKKTIWIVSELFYPDDTSTGYILTEIAKSLSAYYEVKVVCASEYDTSLRATVQLPENINITRIPSFGLNKNLIISRILRILLVSISMWLYAFFRIKSRDIVFIVTNPVLALPLISTLKDIKGFKMNILVHDVFPENLIPGKIFKHENFLFRFLSKIFNWAYKKSDKIFVLGRDMQSLLLKKTGKNENEIKIIENWADTTNIYPTDFKCNSLVKEYCLENKIVLLFAGNIGRLQGLLNLFEIITKVKNKDLMFVFIGNGALKNQLVVYKNRHALTNVIFIDSMPRNNQLTFLNACHFGIVTLDDSLIGLGVPSKAYNILAAGKPIFYIGNRNTEIFKMVNEENCGITFEPNDRLEIINFLNELDCQKINVLTNIENNRSVAQLKYSKEFILNKFLNELKNE